MIGYVTLGTNDIDRARGFYDALLGEIGVARIHSVDHLTIWGPEPNRGMLGLIRPYNGETATVGNGTMVAIPVDQPDLVSKLHEKALALGAMDEGAPGPRGRRKTVFAYCRDLDGHKLAFFCPSSGG